MKRFLGVLLAVTICLTFVTLVHAEEGEPLRNHQVVGLVFEMLKLEMPQGSEKLSKPEQYEIKTNMLADNGVNQFVGSERDSVVNKGTVAKLIFTALVGANQATAEEALDYVAKKGYVAAGQPNEPVFLARPRTIDSEVMKVHVFANLLSEIYKLKMPEGFDKLSKEEQFKIQAKMLDEKCTAKLSEQNFDELVTKAMVADVIYSAIFGCTTDSSDEMIKYFSKLGLMDDGRGDLPVALGINPVAEAYSAPETIDPPAAVSIPPETPGSPI